eukprot:9487203-Pyramimonas_sp.AAC.1
MLEHLPPLEVDFLREVSRKYSTRTACAVDGFHMRHFSWMSDQRLQVYSIMISIMESISSLPLQVQLTQAMLLMKPNGGWRPIGLFCSIYQLWGRCRRIYAQQWEVLFSRPYFAGQSFASATDVVWRQMLKSEAAKSKG